ncbi:MAG: hypothetical protein RJA22_3321, partial [Verrucomicrobiota bacterium]
YLDVPAFIDYLVLEFFAGNDDWPGNNWRAAGSIPLGQPFRFYSWDAEYTLGLSLNHGVAPITIDRTGITNGTPGLLYTALRAHPEFRRRFADQAHRVLFHDGPLTPARCVSRWQRRAAEIHRGIVAESARWGQGGYTNYTRNDWLAEQGRVLNEWLPLRSAVVVTQLQAAGLYPLVAAPTFSPAGGLLSGAVSVTLAAPAGTVYYTLNGADPRLPDGSVDPAATIYSHPILVAGELTLRARVLLTNEWSALAEAPFLTPDNPSLFQGVVTPLCWPEVEVAFQGRPLESHTLEASADLRQWTVQGSGQANEDGFCRFVQSLTNAPARFFRLRWP